MLGIATLIARYAYLRSVVIAVLTSIHPGAMSLRDAPVIVNAIAEAVTFDGAPVWDAELEAGAMADYADHESGLRLHPVPYIDPKTGHPIDGEAHGVWQIHGPAGRADVNTQASYWLTLLHEGAEKCPQSPAAPLSGRCGGAGKRLADRRVREAKRALAERNESSELASDDVGRE